MTTTHRLIVAGFSAVTGAAVGSFVNVCVWRLPRGESLLRPESRCPQCESPIAARDNVPVLGWLLLRGRCRKCKGPIAGRYPLVEGAVGMLFATVALVEISGPLDPLDRGIMSVSGLLLYHSLLTALLVTAGLVEHDRRPESVLVGMRGSGVALIGLPAALGFALMGVFGVPAGFMATGDGIGTVLNLGLLTVFLASRRTSSR